MYDETRRIQELEEEERRLNEQLRRVVDEYNHTKVIAESTSEKINQDLHIKERDLFVKEEEIARLINLENELKAEQEALQLLTQEKNDATAVFNEVDKKVAIAKKKLDALAKMVRAEGEHAQKIQTGMEVHFRQNDPNAPTHDLVIKADSIQDLASIGWEVTINKRPPETPSLVICAVGNYNRGKSFLLGLLSGKSLASGFNITTDGISVIFPDNSSTPVTYLDTKGFETPIPKRSDLIKNMKQSRRLNSLFGDNVPSGSKNENIRMSSPRAPKEIALDSDVDTADIENEIKDRKLCELFLQNFLIEQSDVILIVVGNLTFSDQMMIHRVVNEYTTNRGKRFIIVHNFASFISRQTTEEAVKTEIEEIFDVRKQFFPAQATSPPNSNQTYYVNNRFKEIVHVIMAMEGTDAGNYYNRTAVQFILGSLVQSSNRRVFKIEQELKGYIQNNLPKFIHCDPNKPLPIEYDEHGQCFKLNLPSIRFKMVQFDALDRRFSNEVNEKAPFELKATSNLVILNVELPGMKREEINQLVHHQCLKNKEGYFVQVKGKKIEETLEVKSKLEGNRLFGDFDIVTKALPYSQFDFVSFHDPERFDQDGMMTLRWQLRSMASEQIKQSIF